jgi:hypothetical protein
MSMRSNLSTHRKALLGLALLGNGLIALILALALVVGRPGVPKVGADCSLTSLGVSPLNDLGSRLYRGFSGGLYPDGSNTRPSTHEEAGLDIAANQIQPLDRSGEPDPINGRIVFISIGMSNATAEFGEHETSFKARADADPAKHPQLVIVDGAQSGKTARLWADYVNDSFGTWAELDNRLTAAGVTPAQVQVVWLKEAESHRDLDWGDFPQHAEALQVDLEEIARGITFHFPNARLTYLSSRTRAYTLGGSRAEDLNPEPVAFESGFSVKWTIQRQLAGAPDLNFDPAQGAVVAPWLSWGPYLWADGANPRSDGFVWLCEDVSQFDFTHPSVETGVPKVAEQLVAFFKTDPTATPWFLRSDLIGEPPTCVASADVSEGEPPLMVHFESAASDPDGAIVERVWTFEDGGYAVGQHPTKIFPVPGQYEARLTVTDDDGNTDTCTAPIEVGAPTPTPTATATATATPTATATATATPTATATATPTSTATATATAEPPPVLRYKLYLPLIR